MAALYLEAQGTQRLRKTQQKQLILRASSRGISGLIKQAVAAMLPTTADVRVPRESLSTYTNINTHTHIYTYISIHTCVQKNKQILHTPACSLAYLLQACSSEPPWSAPEQVVDQMGAQTALKGKHQDGDLLSLGGFL